MNKENRKKILITGASGVLGSNLAFFYKKRYDLVGVYREHALDLPGITMVQADLCVKEQVEDLLNMHLPDAVIHCAAMVNIDQCKKDPTEAYRQNVLVTENLAGALTNKNIKLISISTDNVYSASGNHHEDESANPVNEYGQTKLKAEQAALSVKGVAVLRTTFFGCGTCLAETHSEQMIVALLAGEKFRGFDDTFFSPIYVSNLSEIIEGILQKDLKGIFNVGSANGISKFGLLREIALNLGLNTKLLEPISVDSLSLPGLRNKNAIMNVDKIADALDIKIPNVASMVKHFTDDLKNKIIPPGSVLEKRVIEQLAL